MSRLITLELEVWFGLALYTAANGTCPILTEVPPALGNYEAIRTVFAPAFPVGDTPTGDSLRAVAQKLVASDWSGGPKVIVLATDGEPETCSGSDVGARELVVSEAKEAFLAGVRVFPLSVGAGVAGAHLQDVANAGAGLPVGGTANAPYYQALDPSHLVAAFQSILGAVRTCSYHIEGVVDVLRAAEGMVELDGRPLGYESEWRIVDENTLELVGAACDELLGGSDHTLTARFPCEAIIG